MGVAQTKEVTITKKRPAAKIPEVPERGICPLQCFKAGDLLEMDEHGKLHLSPEIDKELLDGDCYIPALFTAEGAVPTSNRSIGCAAIDARQRYTHCEHFLKWFWHTVAKYAGSECGKKCGEITADKDAHALPL